VNASARPALPAGTVTFVFTDIEGSTRLLRQHEARYGALLERHRELVREAFRAGVIFGFEGDAVFAAFESPQAAITAAAVAQRQLTSEPWLDGAALRVRMGIHTGSPRVVAGDYVGLDVHRVARVCAAAHGCQAIASAATRGLVGEGEIDVGFLDLGDHVLKDFDEQAPLYQLVITGCPQEFPPPRTVEARTVQLPRETASLIGREEALGQLAEEVLGHRLVTVTGTGGSGKTRLAVAVAWNVAPRFRGPVAFVEMASLDDTAQIASRLAHAVAPAASISSWDEVLAMLRDQHALVALDNAEHLPGFAAVIRQLLDACPRLHLIVTSRLPVGLPGERLFAVEPLSSEPAVALLIDRVQGHRAGWEPTAEDRVCLVAIARRLDGLPLALELAAGRIRALPLSALLRRLDRQLDMLSSANRELPSRQRTMRGAIQWSYDMLVDDDRALFASISVFTSPASLGMIAAVVERDELEVLDGISRLIDASLVQLGDDSDEPRYRLLEPIRQFAAERLEDAGERDSLQRRVVIHLATEAESARAAGLDMLALFRCEIDTLRQALDYAAELGEWERGLALADAVMRPVFVPMRAPAQLRPWIARVERACPSLSDIARARLLRLSTWVSAANAPDALAMWQQAVALLAGSDDLYLRAESQIGVALNASMIGLVDVAESAIAHAEALNCGSPVIAALVCVTRAQMAIMAGDPNALALYARADELAATADDFALIVHVRGDRAYSAALQGDYEGALRLAESTIAFTDERGVANFATLHTAAVAALALDRIDVAAHHLQRILVTYDQLGSAGDDHLLALYLHAAAAVAAATGGAEVAALLLGGVEASFGKVNPLDSQGVRCYEHHLAHARQMIGAEAWAHEAAIGASTERRELLRPALDAVARAIHEAAHAAVPGGR
jgi:predicted ATPase/class 3 adenylate cyclase